MPAVPPPSVYAIEFSEDPPKTSRLSSLFRRSRPSTDESVHLTIVYEPDEDGWIAASIPEVPGAHSKGRTRVQARENVIEALRETLERRSSEHASTRSTPDSEPLELVIAA
jgi:predicted RNase H-like HicB family nuclease